MAAPRWPPDASVRAGLIGPAVAAYTGALISNTAVPAWHDGYRQMPFVFVGSAAAAAGGLGVLAAPASDFPARRALLAGAVLEVAAMRRMESRMGFTAEPMHSGRAGRLLKSATALNLAGGVLGGALGGRSLVAGVVGGSTRQRFLPPPIMRRCSVRSRSFVLVREPPVTPRQPVSAGFGRSILTALCAGVVGSNRRTAAQ